MSGQQELLDDVHGTLLSLGNYRVMGRALRWDKNVCRQLGEGTGINDWLRSAAGWVPLEALSSLYF